jgi:hypothetical protein
MDASALIIWLKLILFFKLSKVQLVLLALNLLLL